jgi:hypothetical protein
MILRELSRELRRKDEAAFRFQVELVDILSTATQHFVRKRKTSNVQVLDALLTAVSSYVQFAAPEEEWADVGDTLAEELRQRLTIRQVN